MKLLYNRISKAYIIMYTNKGQLVYFIDGIKTTVGVG